MKRMRSKGFIWRRWIPDQIAHQRPPQPQINKSKHQHLASNDKVNQKPIFSGLSSESIDLEQRNNFSISTISSSSSSSTSLFIPMSAEQDLASQNVNTVFNCHNTNSVETSFSNL